MADDKLLDDLNTHYIRAIRDSDTRWFDENLDADFVNTNADGTLSSREAFIAFIGKPCAVGNLQCEDVSVRIIGDAGIVRARTAYMKPDGQPGKGRYTDIWLKRGGTWRCVSAHVTRG